jgi:predicted nicotinamide N-methyase
MTDASLAEQEKETKWRDDQIRFSDCEDDDDDDDRSLNDEEALIDPFADPDPFQVFSFHFLHTKNGETIDIDLRGYKPDSDQVWKSTGVTLWRASEHLCNYMVEHSELFPNKRVLELGAGLGLNGILAHRLGSDHVYVTDGDTDAMKYLRQNVEQNRLENNMKVSSRQLLWGKDTSLTFLEHCNGETFDVLLASDIIYAMVIIPPLWETVQMLLRKPDGVLVMAFARRKVKVSIDYVLTSAEEAGFSYERVDKQDVDGIFVYAFRWKADGDDET